jgi:hypothetical protein
VWIIADRDAGDNMKVIGVNDGEGVVLLGEDEERGFGSGLGDGAHENEGSQKSGSAEETAHADTSGKG